MSQQVINVGTVDNDGTGDDIKTAYGKCNTNFTELYAGKGLIFAIGFACSDMESDLTTGEKIVLDMPFDFVVTRLYASVNTAPTGSAINIDVNDEGSTILSATFSIAASANNGESTSITGTTHAYSKGDALSIDIDQIGSTIAGTGLIVWVEGYRT